MFQFNSSAQCLSLSITKLRIWLDNSAAQIGLVRLKMFRAFRHAKLFMLYVQVDRITNVQTQYTKVIRSKRTNIIPSGCDTFPCVLFTGWTSTQATICACLQHTSFQCWRSRPFIWPMVVFGCRFEISVPRDERPRNPCPRASQQI